MLISVVMSVFNGQDYLMESVASILKQSYKEFEFIIVNDGSTDSTRHILDGISDSRVKVIHLEMNKGAANGLNLAIEQSHGDWIAVQDADDISLPMRLEQQLRYIKLHPDALAVGSLIETISGNVTVPDELLNLEARYKNSFLTREQIKRERFHGCAVCHGSMIYSKKVFNEIGRYSKRYRIAYDYDLWMRFFEKGPIDKILKVLYQYRVDPRSLCHRDENSTIKEQNIIATRAIRKFVYRHLEKRPKIIVFGDERGCQFFEGHIQPESKLRILKYITVADEDLKFQAYDLFINNKVDGIIVLEGIEAQNILYYFINKAMTLNENIFILGN